MAIAQRRWLPCTPISHCRLLLPMLKLQSDFPLYMITGFCSVSTVIFIMIYDWHFHSKKKYEVSLKMTCRGEEKIEIGCALFPPLYLLWFSKHFQNSETSLVVFHIRHVGQEKPAGARKMRNFINSEAVRMLNLTSDRENTKNKKCFRHPKSYSHA